MRAGIEGLVIRRAVSRDASALERLYRQLVTNPQVHVTPARVAEVETDPNTALLVAHQQGQVCATALVAFCADVMFAAQPFAVVENVIVESSVRNQGIGTALFRHIETLCLEKNCSKMMLLSSAGRADAHRFFERAGFTGTTKLGFVKYRHDFGKLMMKNKHPRVTP